MKDILEELERRLNEMTESLRAEGSVDPWEGGCVSQPKARKNILWYLYAFAGAAAGARFHLSRVEDDEAYTEADKSEVRSRIWSRLEQEFTALERDIQKFLYCKERHFLPLSPAEEKLPLDDLDEQPSLTREERRQVVTETLAELELMDQHIHELRLSLRECISEPVQ